MSPPRKSGIVWAGPLLALATAINAVHALAQRRHVTFARLKQWFLPSSEREAKILLELDLSVAVSPENGLIARRRISPSGSSIASSYCDMWTYNSVPLGRIATVFSMVNRLFTMRMQGFECFRPALL
jgi:hypothetical protein